MLYHKSGSPVRLTGIPWIKAFRDITDSGLRSAKGMFDIVNMHFGDDLDDDWEIFGRAVKVYSWLIAEFEDDCDLCDLRLETVVGDALLDCKRIRKGMPAQHITGQFQLDVLDTANYWVNVVLLGEDD